MIQGVWVCAVVAGIVAGGSYRDAEIDGRDKDEPTLYLGGGAVVSSKPYIGMDPRVYPIPLFAYEGKRLYMRGVVGGYRLWSQGGWSVGPIVQPRLEGYQQDDSSALNGMHDRDWSVDVGVGVSWLTKVGFFGLSGVTDVLGRHKGQELEFSYTILFEWAGFDFIPSTGVRYKTENLVDYYYGVEAEEARAGRPAYEGENAVDPFVRLAVRRKLSERWSLLAAVQYEWLDKEISESPIVDRDYEASFMVGMLYAW